MFSKWLTITLSGVGNDIPTRLGKSRPTLTGCSHTDPAVRCISSASARISIISPIKAIPS